MVDDVFGHVAVGFLDAALAEVPGIAVVLVPGTASQAARMRARPAHGWHDEVSGLKALDGRPHVHDLGHRLVADHQMVIPGGRGSVLEGADLLVGAADADVEHPHHDLVRLGEPGEVLLDDLDLLRSWENRDCLHGCIPVIGRGMARRAISPAAKPLDMPPPGDDLVLGIHLDPHGIKAVMPPRRHPFRSQVNVARPESDWKGILQLL